MAKPENDNRANNIAYLLVGVVALAIIIITILTITAIVAGPPAV